MNVEKYVVAYEKNRPIAIFQNAFHVITTDEVNAESTLEFDIHFTDKKRAYLNNQVELRLEGKVYRVKELTDKKENGSVKITHVYAENIYYDLARAATLQSVFCNAYVIADLAFDASKTTVWSFAALARS